MFVAVALGDATLVVDDFLGKETGPVEVEVGREEAHGEGVDPFGMGAGDVAVAKVLAHDRAVLAFRQGVVVAAPGAGFGELLDLKLVEQLGDLMIDVLRAVVGVEPPDGEGEGEDEPFQDGQEESLTDAFDGGDELELGDLVDRVDEVQPLDAVQVALVDAVHAQIALLALWRGLAALADGNLGGPGLVQADPLAAVSGGLAEIVEVPVGNRCQPLVAGVAKQPEGPFAELLGGWPRKSPVKGVQFSQCQDVGLRVTARERLGGLAATVFKPPVCEKPGDQAGGLLAREAADLGEILAQHALVRPAEGRVAEALEGFGDPRIPLPAVGNGEAQGFAAVEEGADLIQ